MTDSNEASSSVVRVCPKCSTQSSGVGSFCPHCGASYLAAERRGPSKRVLLVVAGVVVLALAGLATGLMLQARAEDQAAARADELAERRADRAAAAKAESDAVERDSRAAAVDQLEEEIRKDAREAVDDGLLEGPIESAECTALGGGSVDDLTAITGTFECLAVNREKPDGTLEGYRYSGTIDWDAGTLQWRLGD